MIPLSNVNQLPHCVEEFLGTISPVPAKSIFSFRCASHRSKYSMSPRSVRAFMMLRGRVLSDNIAHRLTLVRMRMLGRNMGRFSVKSC